jgi:hypothetical protein
LVLAPALASDEKAKETEKSKSDKEESLSFTNEDLARRYSGGEKKKPTSAPPKSSTSEEKPVDNGAAALEKLFADRDSRKENAGKVVEAEAAVVAARERVTQLEKKKLAVVNPFMARPAPPEDKEEAERWKAMDGSERAAAAQIELDEARKALADAESALAGARRN